MMDARTKPIIMEVDMSELADVLRRAEAALDTKDYETLKALAECRCMTTHQPIEKYESQ